MVLDDIGLYLQQQGIGTLGTDVFLYAFPDGQPDCIALFEYQGEPPSQKAGMEAPGLQVCVRNKDDFEAARRKLQDIHNVLKLIGFEENEQTAQGTVINGVSYFRVAPVLSGIIPLGPDENGYVLLAKNYYIYKEEE